MTCIGKDPRCPCQDGDACHYKDCGDTKALPVPVAQPEQEPVAVDQDTMELAESVGLIGPASRTHDLHAAIQRFHDLICANATIKAAVAFSRTLEAKDEPVAWKWHQAPVKTSWGHDMVVADLAIDKDNTVSVYCERNQTTKVEAMFTTPTAAQRPWQGLEKLKKMEDLLEESITALKAALEQPEQEPVAYYHPRNGFYWAKPTSIFAPTSVDVERLPLYTAAERNNG